eukprot:749232-Hanusia_phi.AAC.3
MLNHAEVSFEKTSYCSQGFKHSTVLPNLDPLRDRREDPARSTRYKIHGSDVLDSPAGRCSSRPLGTEHEIYVADFIALHLQRKSTSRLYRSSQFTSLRLCLAVQIIHIVTPTSSRAFPPQPLTSTRCRLDQRITQT